MRPVTDQFLSTVRGSHRMATVVKLVTTYQEGVDPDGDELDVIRGDVMLDADADVRGSCNVTVDGNDAFTRDPAGQLTPYGNELHIARGVVYGAGTRELVSQGYFRLYVVRQDDRPDAPITLIGRDRMSGIIDGRLEVPRQFATGTTVQSIFDDLVLEIYPDATIDFDYDATSDTVNTNYVADEDRYTFLRDLMKARGKIMYWDYRGRLQVRDPPNATETVFDVNAGANGVLIALGRDLNREGVYNAVVALGEAPTTDVEPVHAIARDMNPESATFWEGRFGKVPRFFKSPFITTLAQAQSAAESILQSAIGLPYRVDFSAVPNTALEPLDPIRITTEDGVEKHVLESIRIPLEFNQPMTATTRKLTSVIIESEEAE